jgi:uncharacterized protein (DUF58 family)
MKVRPTRHATLFFLILGAMFLASINYQSNAAWLMVFVIFTAGVMSALHGLRNLWPVTVTAAEPPLVEAGDRARLTVTVASSTGRELEALFVELADDQLPDDLDPEQRHNQHHCLLVPHLAALGSVRVELLLPSFPRGVHRLRALRLSTQYPLGLWRIFRQHTISVELFVHPQPRGLSLSQARSEPLAEIGTADPAEVREYEDFRGLKPWQSSDSPRHIDWKAAARSTGPLLIKEWSGGGHGVTWLSWAATSGDDETRLSQLAKWVIEAHHLERSYGLRLPGTTIEPSTGGNHHLACLRALAIFLGDARSSAARPAWSSGPRPGSTASVTGVHRIPPGIMPRAPRS